jgi:hypothetical protein
MVMLRVVARGIASVANCVVTEKNITFERASLREFESFSGFPAYNRVQIGSWVVLFMFMFMFIDSDGIKVS